MRQEVKRIDNSVVVHELELGNKTLFQAISDSSSSIIKSVFDYHLSSVYTSGTNGTYQTAENDMTEPTKCVCVQSRLRSDMLF